MTSATEHPDAGRAILTTLRDLASEAPTACAGWTAHHIAAHLAAGSREIADLAEDRAAGRPPRPTRPFDERERPYRQMPYADVLDEMVRQTRRKLDAYQALGKTSDEPNIAFTGTTITVDELTTHSRSEASLHRWDLVGDDALGDELLAEPALTAHAVNILNRMPVLAESAHSMAARAAASAPRPPRVVVRTPDSPDVRIDTAGVGYAELGGAETLDGDVIVTTDPANRLLVLWGRRSAHRSIEIEGPADLAAALPAIVWPNAQPWPPA